MVPLRSFFVSRRCKTWSLEATKKASIAVVTEVQLSWKIEVPSGLEAACEDSNSALTFGCFSSKSFWVHFFLPIRLLLLWAADGWVSLEEFPSSPWLVLPLVGALEEEAG